MLTLIVPRELELDLGVALSAQRLILIFFTPLALKRLAAPGGRIQLRAFDYLICAAYAYIFIAQFFKEDASKALAFGGSQLLETLGGYLIARAYITNARQFEAVVKLLIVLALALGVVAAAESILQQQLLKNAIRSVLGWQMLPPLESRLGLMRALTVFDHPIHYGAFCSVVLALAWHTVRGFMRRIWTAAALTAAAFFSLSSAPLIGIALVVAVACWERCTRSIPNRAALTFGLGMTAYAVVDLMASRTPIQILSTSFVLDPATAWYRWAILEYGTANVLNSPWFGVRFDHWVRPDWMYSTTVDNYWLLLAMTGGLPCLLLLVAGITWIVMSVGARHFEPGELEQQCRMAWVSAVVVLCFIGMTVHYWREMQTFFLFCIGLGGWMAGLPVVDAVREKVRQRCLVIGKRPSSMLLRTNSEAKRAPIGGLQ